MEKTTTKLIKRPPVVVVLGHIDHGKSTLLDYIRQTKVTAKEAGGITQNLNAYEATLLRDNNQPPAKITFLDTPGHDAFAAARRHGATLADLAILVISAEEGVKPQTLEALHVINASPLPYIVVLNKMDRPTADPERVKQQLAEAGVFLEGYGGKVSAVKISAKTGEGVNDLLELVLLAAELEELRGDASQKAEGFVLDAKLNPRAGVIVYLLIKNGTLRLGDFVAAGGQLGKVKQLRDFLSRRMGELSFSSPAEVIGFSELPEVGMSFRAFAAKEATQEYLRQAPTREKQSSGQAEDKEKEPNGQKKGVIPLVIKAANPGGLNAVEQEIAKLTEEEIVFKVIAGGVGEITENDLRLAETAPGSLLLGFGVNSPKPIRQAARERGLKIISFDVIYRLADELMEETRRRRPTGGEEVVIGRAQIIKTFGAKKNRQIVGGQVAEGRMASGWQVIIRRQSEEIGRGKIVELEQSKIKTAEVQTGKQFGALIDAKTEIASGDILELVETKTG